MTRAVPSIPRSCPRAELSTGIDYQHGGECRWTSWHAALLVTQVPPRQGPKTRGQCKAAMLRITQSLTVWQTCLQTPKEQWCSPDMARAPQAVLITAHSRADVNRQAARGHHQLQSTQQQPTPLHCNPAMQPCCTQDHREEALLGQIGQYPVPVLVHQHD